MIAPLCFIPKNRMPNEPFRNFQRSHCRFNVVCAPSLHYEKECYAAGLAAAVIASSSDAIITKNLDGTITSWNPAAERLFGYSADEAIGRSVTMLFPADHINEESEIIRRIKNGKRIDHFETIRKRKDGSMVPISLTVSPIKNHSGEIIGASKVARDITDQRKINEAAWHRSAVVESSSDAIITKSLDGIITSWNKAAERIFGYTSEEAIGKPVTILFPSDHINEEPEIIRRIKNGEHIEPYETIRKRKDGSSIPISLTVSPIRDVNRAIVGASKIARDITTQKAYEQRLVAQANELEQFAYVASHDLKEPLRKIVLYSDLLFETCKGAAGDAGQRHVTAITSAVTRMQTLINDLLNYSRTNREEFKTEPVDFNVVVQEVIQDVSLPGENSAEVTFDPLPTIKASAFQIYQLFQNLISNATKFRGENVPKVHISAKKMEEEFVISVKDNGIGIEPRYQEQIFRVFQRLHTGQKYPGTGIGLAICKKVVEQHGGKIWVESKVGEGSTFFFSLKA